MERKVREEAMESITERLSSLDNLYFPRAVQSSAADPSHRKSILHDLLARDVPVFLERYGSELTSDELHEFDALNDDYEVNWHLKHLRSKLSPTSEELKSRSVTVKNRRRAYLNKLVCDGQYFSEDAMREREPYLHHEYLGRFQDLSGRSMARPGERWSETLMRRCEEARLVAKIREEQQRLGVAQKDWVGNESYPQQEEEEEEDEEEEEEEEEEENGGDHGKEMLLDHPGDGNVAASATVEQHEEAPSAEEMQDRMDQFTYIMQQKFLSGEDYEHLDYSKIDDDETLDDHWLREANYDAEEKYFAED
ncbi:coiled-coil domain-containing protein 97 isoform X1 [Durio zibethinus]|uniref:Coiled-coil domain-containing protein 97 isoform X1 n=1 Tax=Durio zibethinus TaxID=66656 RepID=A0A6P5Y8J5_DURZI|nr:coiled-coil domain-containing protein 97 isoform X1 [Durio zibethinus]